MSGEVIGFATSLQVFIGALFLGNVGACAAMGGVNVFIESLPANVISDIGDCSY
jgi:hypothetical protein